MGKYSRGGGLTHLLLQAIRAIFMYWRWRDAQERDVADRTRGEGVLSDDQANGDSSILHSEVFSFRQNVHQCASAGNLLKGCYPGTDTGRVFYRRFSSFRRLFNFWRRSKRCLLRKRRTDSQLRSFFKRSECNNFFTGGDGLRLILGNPPYVPMSGQFGTFPYEILPGGSLG